MLHVCGLGWAVLAVWGPQPVLSLIGASRLGCRRKEGLSCFIPGLLPLGCGLLVPAPGHPTATCGLKEALAHPHLVLCLSDPLGLWEGTSAWASHLSAEDTHRDTRAHTNCGEEVLLKAHRHTHVHTPTLLGKGFYLGCTQMHKHTHP